MLACMYTHLSGLAVNGVVDQLSIVAEVGSLCEHIRKGKREGRYEMIGWYAEEVLDERMDASVSINGDTALHLIPCPTHLHSHTLSITACLYGRACFKHTYTCAHAKIQT